MLISFMEWINGMSVWGQDENGVLDDEGDHRPMSYYKVTATCGRCGHKWRVRGALQIIDLPNHPKHRDYTKPLRGAR